VQEAALAQAKATLPPLRKALAQQRDLLAALSGAYAGDGPRETFRLANLHLPVDLPVSLPSQLIEQRPDVRAAEEQLHAASAQVGVATANLLPNFTISANGGYIQYGIRRPDLTAKPGLGARRQCNANDIRRRHLAASACEGARDTYQAAAWTYRGTVIGAVQNVADALRALQNDADALKAARDFERAAKISFDLAQQQLDKPATPTCCCSSRRSRLICRRSSRWCRRKRRGSPTPRLYSRRSAAAGGTARAADGEDS
jgi:outer membrane protein TolC